MRKWKSHHFQQQQQFGHKIIDICNVAINLTGELEQSVCEWKMKQKCDTDALFILWWPIECGGVHLCEQWMQCSATAPIAAAAALFVHSMCIFFFFQHILVPVISKIIECWNTDCNASNACRKCTHIIDLCVVNKSFMMIYELNDIALKCYNNNHNVIVSFTVCFALLCFALFVHLFDVSSPNGHGFFVSQNNLLLMMIFKW